MSGADLKQGREEDTTEGNLPQMRKFDLHMMNMSAKIIEVQKF